MKINSKKKGAAGERELSNILKEVYGYETRRSQQFCGKSGESADVIGLPGIHIECKRVEKLSIDKAMEQAVNDCDISKGIPAVFHRSNKKPWKVTLLLEDFMTIYEGKLNESKTT